MIRDRALEPPRQGGYLYRKYRQNNVNWDSEATINQLRQENEAIKSQYDQVYQSYYALQSQFNEIQGQNIRLISDNTNLCAS
jgi:hypothetical protein